MIDHSKRNEWLEFRSKHPTSATWKDCFNWVKNPKSLFHDEVKWSRQEIEEDYYRKTCTNLMMRNDAIYCNVETSYQRLHCTYSEKHLDKGVRRRVSRTAAEIAKSDTELAFVRAAIWGRLRRVVSDMHEFRNYLPEFAELYEFLVPRVSVEMQAPEGERLKKVD